MLNTYSMKTSSLMLPFSSINQLNLESTLKDLSLYDDQVDINQPGIILTQKLEENPLIPGVMLTQNGRFSGMISRRIFLECLSRPYGRELFLQRSIRSLQRFAQSQLLVLSGDTLIVEAAHRVVKRSPELLYEPIIVQLTENQHQLLDIQQLLVAQSSIHQLATELLRQQTQSQLIQTEKLASLGKMVAGVAHEIRNPVSCILGNSSCLLNYYQDLIKLIQTYEENIEKPCPAIDDVKAEIDFEFLQQDLGEAVKSILVSSERLSQLVNSLHSFSHMDGSQRREINIHDCLDGTLLILKNRLKHGIEVVKNYGDIPLLKCYSGQLSQVFMNLISNAIDALEEREENGQQFPKIEINTQVKILSQDQIYPAQLAQFSQGNRLLYCLPSDQKSLSLVEQDIFDIDVESEWLSISIRDNGMGIPQEIQTQIFDTFFTTKPAGKGTGLGLAISYQIISEKHGGQLNFISNLGVGTEFEILLPIL
ncbi:two-component sensor histidine kinase [Planktothrix agardhii CCAP 1459/11A]|uniref:histidine kinase n=4 Tax=Planktothrix TaxID=54304 RepID=A0A479ZQC7_PLAAG|nr:MULTISPECIES: ATP-binding protein [Planktothrix]CAC5342705.1 Histidine kinase [Planktothrix rubescens NIVA-CYA 18]CAD5972869.1 Sensor kinase CckA [Planktothrix rubescens]CAD5972349.1 Sensor kinase CckA [Planktothrix rubescens NIVA-CYA 18]CAH2574417.1 Sensor kinase CckA [Planktothrix rubescens]GCL34890.1 two-component sensor histidine kinase [Planktothrix agardhii CCAP 1459/11A]